MNDNFAISHHYVVNVDDQTHYLFKFESYLCDDGKWENGYTCHNDVCDEPESEHATPDWVGEPVHAFVWQHESWPMDFKTMDICIRDVLESEGYDTWDSEDYHATAYQPEDWESDGMKMVGCDTAAAYV